MKTFFLLLAAAFLFLQTGKACTIIVAGKKATVDGSVLIHTRMPVRIVASGSWRARNSPKEAWLPCITAYSELTSP